MNDQTSFQDELERLESIVRQLETDDIDLDKALELFEEGVGRLKKARDVLNVAEMKVKRVIAQSGEHREEDLDV